MEEREYQEMEGNGGTGGAQGGILEQQVQHVQGDGTSPGAQRTSKKLRRRENEMHDGGMDTDRGDNDATNAEAGATERAGAAMRAGGQSAGIDEELAVAEWMEQILAGAESQDGAAGPQMGGTPAQAGGNGQTPATAAEGARISDGSPERKRKPAKQTARRGLFVRADIERDEEEAEEDKAQMDDEWTEEQMAIAEEARKLQTLSLEGKLRFEDNDFAVVEVHGETVGLPEAERPEEDQDVEVVYSGTNLQERYEASVWVGEGDTKRLTTEAKALKQLLAAKRGGTQSGEVDRLQDSREMTTAAKEVHELTEGLAGGALSQRLQLRQIQVIQPPAKEKEADRLKRENEITAQTLATTEAGWDVEIGGEEDQYLVAQAVDMITRKALFRIPEVVVQRRNFWLGVVEQLGDRRKDQEEDAECSDREKKATTHHIDLYLDQIEILDLSLQLAWYAQVRDNVYPVWDETLGFVAGWTEQKMAEVTTDEELIEEEQEPLNMQLQYYAKIEEYEARMVEEGAEAIQKGVEAGMEIQDLVVTPLEDPNTPLEMLDRTPALACSEVNALMGMEYKVARVGAILKAPSPPNMVLDEWALPWEGWVTITVHNLSRVYLMGDRRYGSPMTRRKRLARHFRERGLEIRDVVLYMPLRGEEIPLEVDFKAQFRAGENLREWLRGERTVWYGEDQHRSQLWGTFTPKDSVWVQLEGAEADSLNLWVAAMALADPDRWTYPEMMKMTHQRIRGAGWKTPGEGPGPVRAQGSRMEGGKRLHSPWFGETARYAVLARNAQTAEVFARQLSSKKSPIKLYEGKFHGISKHVGKMILLQSLEEDDEDDDEGGMVAMSVKPLWLTEWTINRVTKEAFDVDTLTPHALQDGILHKIWQDIPWTRGKLLKVKVRDGPTGHWNKSWVILLWDASKENERYVTGFLKMVNRKEAVEWAEGADHTRVDVNEHGEVTVYIRYDFWVSRYSSRTASSGLTAVMADARNSDFRPPTMDREAWVQGNTGEEEERVCQLKWVRGEMPKEFKVGKPEQVSLVPGTYAKGEVSRRVMHKVMGVIALVLQKRKRVWVPAPVYEREDSNLLWLELQPEEDGHVDLRRLTLETPALAEIFDDKDIFYEALAALVSQGDVRQETKDRGVVLTKAVDAQPITIPAAAGTGRGAAAPGTGRGMVVPGRGGNNPRGRGRGGWGIRRGVPLMGTGLPPRYEATGPPPGPGRGRRGGFTP